MKRSYARAAAGPCLLLSAALLAGCGSQSDAGSGARRDAKVPAVHVVDKAAADAKRPGAGICTPPPGGPVVTVTANPDTPDPRCIAVRADQRLRVLNKSDGFGSPGERITVRWAAFAPRTIDVEQATTFSRPFGSYLEPGDHFLRISLYPGSSAEVYLRGHK